MQWCILHGQLPVQNATKRRWLRTHYQEDRRPFTGYILRQIIRTALEYAECAAKADAQQEDNKLCLEKTLELLERVYGKRVRIEELETVLKKTIRQKALVKLFYW